MDEMTLRGMMSRLAGARAKRLRAEANLDSLLAAVAATPEAAVVAQAQAALDATSEAQNCAAELEMVERFKALEEAHYVAVRGCADGLARQSMVASGGRDWLGIKGLTLRVTKTWGFVTEFAENWARTSAPTLIRLDEKAYIKAAPNLPGAPGCWEYSYTPAIDKDLSQYLLEGDDNEPAG